MRLRPKPSPCWLGSDITSFGWLQSSPSPPKTSIFELTYDDITYINPYPWIFRTVTERHFQKITSTETYTNDTTLRSGFFFAKHARWWAHCLLTQSAHTDMRRAIIWSLILFCSKYLSVNYKCSMITSWTKIHPIEIIPFIVLVYKNHIVGQILSTS